MSVKPAIGLYFNDNFIEVSQLSEDGKKLKNFNKIFLPIGMVVNGDIRDRKNFVLVLKTLFATAKPSPIATNQDVVIGVSDNLVFLREFTVPKFAGKGVDEAVDYQVRTLQPVLPAGAETDWLIVGRNEEDQIEVLLAALSAKLIESYLTVCSEVGLNVVDVEPAVFANTRIIDPEQIQGKNILLVYLGDNFATFSFITNGNPRFSDYILGSDIAKGGDIIKTIKSYVNFANSKHETRKITEIIVSGFSQQIGDVAESLKRQGDLAFLVRNRIDSLSVDSGLLHTSYGLSLKTFYPINSLNLLPVANRLGVIRNRYVAIWKNFLTVMIVLSMFVAVALYYFLQSNQTKFRNLNAIKTQYLNELSSTENKQLIESTNELNSLTGKLVILRQVTGGEEGLLREIAAVTPEGIKFSSLIFARGNNSKKLNDETSDWVLSGVANSRPAVLDFYKNLLSEPDFTKGQLYFGSLEKDLMVGFRIANPKQL